MKRKLALLFTAIFSFASLCAQETGIIGKIVDAGTNKALPGAHLFLEGNTSIETNSDANGEFNFGEQEFPLGEQVLIASRDGYLPKNLPVVIEERKILDMKTIGLEIDFSDQAKIATIALSDTQLDKDIGGADNIAGLLQASKDVFLNAAAYDFSATFFRPRGLESENGKVFINGVVMNELYDGGPEWSTWGGLNDMQRNRVFSMGLSPNEFDFGGLAGSTNIRMRASKYRQGGKISYAAANRSYTGRVSASYNSGLSKNGWAYSVLFTRRFGEEGFRDGTLYDANSFFAAVEKELNDAHSLNLMAYYVPYRRGKASPNTQEVYDLKGTKYNSYWGYQDGKIRNSRIKRFNEPVVMLNHYWDISEKTRLNTNLAYKFGESGSSRLGYDDALNPDPAYYRKLPGYALAQDPPNLVLAYENYSSFVNDGQIDWNQLYRTNSAFGGPARYYLYDDRTDDRQIYANTILNSQLTNNIKLTAALRYRKLNSENFAYMVDLLGAENYLDVDTFSSGDEAQSDLQNPNRLVDEEERFSYNYELDATVYSGFAQAQFKYKKVDFYLAGKMGKTSYLRTGLYQNGNFPDNSLGESEEMEFTTYGGKAGATYKITGKHFVQLNAGYFTKAPSMRNSFSNSRQNNDVVIGLEEEKIKSADLSYLFRSRIINARLTGYWSLMEDATEISFYYADGIASPVAQNQPQGTSGLARNQTTAFVQEVLTGIEKKHIGTELGIEAQVTPAIKLKGAAAIGQFTYANNPNLYLTSDDFDTPLQYGESYLENYHIAGGPERAYQIGFEYRDPDYWFFGATTNYFSNAYVDVAPITRTQNFYLDVDGVPFNDYDPEVARRLLKQEQFGDYFLVNFIGGKSWKIDDYYLGFFGVISNVLDETYKTGGFEQGRSANYRELLADTSNDTRVFGPKYWYGYGTTFYLNLYIRF